MNLTRRGAALAALALTAALAVAGCGSSSDTTTGAASEATSAPGQEAAVTLSDAWVKAAPSGMTAMFGTLHNTTGSEVTIEGGSSSVAGKVELHEVVMAGGEMKMQPKAGGFAVPAGGTHELAPGGDHIMLLELREAVNPGDRIEVTLDLSDGGTVTVSGVAKEYAGGNESYQPSPGGSTEDGMSMEPSESGSET